MAERVQKYLVISDENFDKVKSVIKRAISRRRSKTLENILSMLHPTGLSSLWPFFSDTERTFLLDHLDEETSAELLSELDNPDRTEIIRAKDTDWIVDRLEELETDDIVDILKGLSQWEANFIIRRFKNDYSQQIKELMRYPEETAGALMSSDFLAVSENAKTESIIKQFRKIVEKDQIADIHFIYVVNRKNELQGYIPLRKLILEDSKLKAREIMSSTPVTVTPDMDQETVAEIFRDYNLITIPVTNDDGVLLGRITVDDIVDVVEKEASEDVYMMVGLGKDDSLSNSVATSLKSRMPWMFVNLFTSSLSALVIYFFTNIIEKFTILAAFMPMVAAIGGATGNQMVAMIVRGLALKELHWPQVRSILTREVTAVFFGALVIGSIIGFGAFYIKEEYILGFVVSISLIINMVIATLIGAGIPLVLKLFRLDPAMGSSILVAAVTDMVGFFIFLCLATKIMTA